MLNTLFGGEKLKRGRESGAGKREGGKKGKVRRNRQVGWGCPTEHWPRSKGAVCLSGQAGRTDLVGHPLQRVFEGRCKQLLTIQWCHALSGTWRGGESPADTVWLLFLQGDAKARASRVSSLFSQGMA